VAVRVRTVKDYCVCKRVCLRRTAVKLRVERNQNRNQRRAALGHRVGQTGNRTSRRKTRTGGSGWGGLMAAFVCEHPWFVFGTVYVGNCRSSGSGSGACGTSTSTSRRRRRSGRWSRRWRWRRRRWKKTRRNSGITPPKSATEAKTAVVKNMVE
jgi:hypothetical protein